MPIMTATRSTVSRASAGWRDHQVSVLAIFSVRTLRFGSEIGRSLSHLLKARTARVGGIRSVSQGLTVAGPTRRHEGSNAGGGGVGPVELFVDRQNLRVHLVQLGHMCLCHWWTFFEQKQEVLASILQASFKEACSQPTTPTATRADYVFNSNGIEVEGTISPRSKSSCQSNTALNSLCARRYTI